MPTTGTRVRGREMGPVKEPMKMREAASESDQGLADTASELTCNAQTGRAQGDNGCGPRLCGEGTDPGNG